MTPEIQKRINSALFWIARALDDSDAKTTDLMDRLNRASHDLKVAQLQVADKIKEEVFHEGN
jgi:hypothetical protein